MNQRTVTLERDGDWLRIIFGKDDSSISHFAFFSNFDRICRSASGLLGRQLTERQSLNVQRMLGATDIRELTLGPGANFSYERVK